MTCAADWFDAARFVAVDRRAELLIQRGCRSGRSGGGRQRDVRRGKIWLEYDWDHGLASDLHKDDRAKFCFGAVTRH